MSRVTVRPAMASEETRVIAVIDAAMLSFDRDAVPARIARGDALVATHDDSIVGAVLLDGDRIEAVAVRPSARGRGYGRALVETAFESRDTLIASFDSSVRPFYAALGFSLEKCGDGRWVGVLERD